MEQGDLTLMLQQWSGGDAGLHDALFERIYVELMHIAARHVARERSDSDIEPQALVHEAYLRLIDMTRIRWQDRAHFFAMSATVMRQILIDEARRRLSGKRDGGIQITLTGIADDNAIRDTDVLQLHYSLERLAAIDPQRARLVELRYFAGLTIKETAEVLGISPATVKRQWEVARGWLYRAMQADTRPAS